MIPPHQPVLYQSIIAALKPISPGNYIDATTGAGGHAHGILEASKPDGFLLGFDLDPFALQIAQKRLESFQGRFKLVQTSYVSLSSQVTAMGWEHVQGIVIDLGVSSMQIDTPERGFSFLKDGPLDMRFNPLQKITAADLINSLSEKELADILYRYGEETQSRRIAHQICQTRPHQSTLKLAETIQSVAQKKTAKIHPATKTFQALRIAVNNELGALEAFLPQAIAALSTGGRLAVISFHSLEDRIVKQFFRQQARNCLCPPQQPLCTCGHQAAVLEINRHPILADEEEIRNNPRARSARLRVVEKI